jgi:hypothetical protein
VAYMKFYQFLSSFQTFCPNLFSQISAVSYEKTKRRFCGNKIATLLHFEKLSHLYNIKDTYLIVDNIFCLIEVLA